MEIKRMSKELKEISGLHSDDPDNDPHNRQEYTTCENGDECCECIVCGVDFFGFRHRNECGVCHSILAGGSKIPTQDPKYMIVDDRICNVASGKPIPVDEPIFILRAKDMLASQTLVFYKTMVITDQHKQAARHRIAHFNDFARDYPERMKAPDTVYPFPKVDDQG